MMMKLILILLTIVDISKSFLNINNAVFMMYKSNSLSQSSLFSKLTLSSTESPSNNQQIFDDYVRKIDNRITEDDDKSYVYLLEKYDGDELSKYYNKRPLQLWQRLIEIGSPLMGWLTVKLYDEMMWWSYSEEKRAERIKAQAIDLKDSIVQSKSISLIKSGQALSLRSDIIKNTVFINALETLVDEVGCFDNDVALNIIKSELKTDNLDDIFEFDPLLPIASASIGQVYRAKLKKSNEYVAIKVQRPDAQRTATIDMYLIRTLASYIKQLKKIRSDLVGIADLFGNQLFNELGKLFDSILNWLRTRYHIYSIDYIKEAKNCQLFKSLYGNGNVPGIYVPDVKVEYTTSKVLVMEYIEGVKGPWTANLDDGRRMLNIGLQCSVLQLLGTGFIHTGIR